MSRNPIITFPMQPVYCAARQSYGIWRNFCYFFLHLLLPGNQYWAKHGCKLFSVMFCGSKLTLAFDPFAAAITSSRASHGCYSANNHCYFPARIRERFSSILSSETPVSGFTLSHTLIVTSALILSVYHPLGGYLSTDPEIQSNYKTAASFGIIGTLRYEGGKGLLF